MASEAPMALETPQGRLPGRGTLELNLEGWDRSTEWSSKGVPGQGSGRCQGLEWECGMGVKAGEDHRARLELPKGDAEPQARP